MSRRKKGEDVSGWIVLDKPEEMTSTHAVSAIKRVFNANKAGHAGTLDPLASGILPIALGEATKTVPWLMEAEKTYLFTIKWGVSTQTQDREGEPTATSDVRPTPELHFQADVSYDEARHIDELLASPEVARDLKHEDEA